MRKGVDISFLRNTEIKISGGAKTPSMSSVQHWPCLHQVVDHSSSSLHGRLVEKPELVVRVDPLERSDGRIAMSSVFFSEDFRLLLDS